MLDRGSLNKTLVSLLNEAGQGGIGHYSFDMLHAVCSEAVHTLSPPPYYLLLEAKLFKYLLSWLAEAFEATAKSFTKLYGGS